MIKRLTAIVDSCMRTRSPCKESLSCLNKYGPHLPDCFIKSTKDNKDVKNWSDAQKREFVERYMKSLRKRLMEKEKKTATK